MNAPALSDGRIRAAREIGPISERPDVGSGKGQNRGHLWYPALAAMRLRQGWGTQFCGCDRKSKSKGWGTWPN
jgi:hypothetical protein